MGGFLTAAVLCAALMAPSVFGVSPSVHARHQQLHNRRGMDHLTAKALAAVQNENIKTGRNYVNTAGVPISIVKKQNDSAISDDAFLFEFVNLTDDELLFAMWSNADGNCTSVSAMFPTVCQPDILVSLKNGTKIDIELNPTYAVGGTIGGGFMAQPLPADGSTLLNDYGQPNATIGEFDIASQYSTVDISRLINMAGYPMEMKVFANYAETDPVCKCDMNSVVYQCVDGTNTCMQPPAAQLVGCIPGTANTTCEYDNSTGAWNGGCSGLSPSNGFVKTYFYAMDWVAPVVSTTSDDTASGAVSDTDSSDSDNEQ